MGLIIGLLLIVIGLLAASSVVGNLSEDLEQAIDEHLRPVQGWVGLVACVAGILFLVQVLLSVGSAFKTATLGVVIAAFVGPTLLAATGFLMGFSKIMSLIASSDEAEEKARELYQTLSPYQVALGLASIAAGVFVILV